MDKITIEEFVKRVNALKGGEHVSVQLVEDGYIVTAFAAEVKGNREHFMMVEGFYGNCEHGFEGFDEQGIYEYIDYVKNLDTETQDMDEITELIVVEENKKDKIDDYEQIKIAREKTRTATMEFLNEAMAKYGNRFELKCIDYDNWDEAIEHEGSNISNQLPYSVSCQDFSGGMFEVHLTSVFLVEGNHTAYVSGYSFDDGHGFESDEKCYLYAGNLEAVADFVNLVIKESEDC